MATDRWKAIRAGREYCAPACGCGCTWKEYKAAKKAGRKLAKRLGDGWKVRVWENMGWHYSAIDSSGYLKVHPFEWEGKVSYTAFLGPSQGGGEWAEHGDTPEEAIRNTVMVARQRLDYIQSVLEIIAE